MNYTNCGNNLPNNSVFCPNCGSSVQTVATPAPQQSMYQPTVNEQQNIYQQPISNQQAMYQQPMYAQQPYNPCGAPQKKSKAPWIALGASLFLVIAIVALSLYC